ncbi:MAG: hypothetical protein IJ837_01805 [Clostridia bacterium]|nr:hypothetical protein [Clostridia bacterium]
MKVVTICGSMKFANQMKKIAGDISKKNGWCVLQCVYDIDVNKTTKEELKILKQAHFKKIDLSDAIYVVNIGGYVGDSTKSEIEYATKNKKEIIYHEKIKAY